MSRHLHRLFRVGRGLAVAVAFATPLAHTLASGTYVPSAGGPPRQLRMEDFHLGKALYLREATPQAPLDAVRLETQRPVLVAVQQRLPKRTAGAVDLPQLAGRLTDDELNALLYFVRMRFKISIPDPETAVS